IVDHTTGKVTKVEPITRGKDLTDATAQRAAMAKATQALRAVVTAALTARPGAQAVSLTPKVQGDHAVAEITLLEHGAMTMVSEPWGKTESSAHMTTHGGRGRTRHRAAAGPPSDAV